MNVKLLLKGGRVIDPEQSIDGEYDLGINHEGKIEYIGMNSNHIKADVIKDVSGMLILPGLIDLHTHVYWGGGVCP
ncbi:Dihydroorotase [subsurface metagenome]